MQILFVHAMEQWIRVQLEEIGPGLRTLPVTGTEQGIEKLYAWEPPGQRLFRRVVRGYTIEQLAAELAKNTASTEAKPGSESPIQSEHSV